VHSTKTAHESIVKFGRYGKNLVVQWNAEDVNSDMWLESAIMVARALSVRITTHGPEETASFERVDKCIESIRKLNDGFEEIITSANTTKSAAEKISKRAEKMRAELKEQLELIAEEFNKVKAPTKAFTSD
jgi:methyl-accepting chemotaxis protein